jgi:DNA polymerase-3 subunit gamma/tau
MAGDVPSPGAPSAPMALYRRYRPATFAELKGQDHVTEPLRQALRSGRVHHAYLFSGPRGCGKTSSARILARSLNCEQGPTPDPCGKCASCVALAPSGPGSIDVIEIDAASHGGVDDARDLRERAFYAPVAGRFKIYIVDEAHMVTREGFNALLKLVEEPPPHLKFVFATTEPEKVIPTIRSRTHHYPFRLMPPAILRGLLEEILASEGVSYEPGVLPVVIRAGAGSARDALSVLDQLLAGSNESGLTYEQAVTLLGYTDESLLDEVAEAFATGDGAAVFRAVDRVVEAGHDPRRFAADLLDRLRDLIVLDAVPDAADTGLLDVPDDQLDRMREQADRFGQARLTRAADTINAGLVEMRGATSPRLQLELICAQVLLPGESDLLARLERLERALAAGGPAGAGRPRTDPDDPPAASAGAGRPARAGASAAAQSRPAAAGTGPGPAPAQDAAPGRVAAPADSPAAAAPARPAAAPGPARPAAAPGPARPAAAPGPARPEPAATADQPRAAAARPPAPGTVDAAVLRERWPMILDAVKHQKRVAWLLLSNASVDTLQDGVLTLRFTREGEAKGFSGSGYDQELGRVLQNMLGISPRVRAVAAPPTAPSPLTGGAGSSWAAGPDLPPDEDEPGDPAGPGGEPGGYGESGAGGRVTASTGGAGPGRGNVSGQAGSGASGRAGSGGGAPARAGAGGGGTGPGAAGNSEALTGMDLIARTLGGEVIDEIGDA